MRVLVCGGRKYSDYFRVCQVLGSFHESRGIACIIQGGALGADALAKRWARFHEVALEEYAADWERFGRAAGPERNTRMLHFGRPDLVIAFPGGAGTADMVRQARAAGVRVVEEV